MKTVMIIDGAENCSYDCFLADEVLFRAIFPEQGQNIEFIEDLQERGTTDIIEAKFSEMWSRFIPKAETRGIDGVLFYDLRHKKSYYPTKKDSDLDHEGRSG